MSGFKFLRIPFVKKLSFVIQHRSTLNIFSRAAHFQPKEICIKVPWGHIAGLQWNDEKSTIPILCLHGWKDSAASFNRLIPAILQETTKYQFVCIDLPGHGFSSHYPPGMLYQTLDSIIALRRVIKHFEWSEDTYIHLLGHSLGAILAFLFASSHPTMVDSVIAVDALLPVTFGTEMVGMFRHISECILNLETSTSLERASQTNEKAVLYERMLKSHMASMDKVACEILMTRCIVEVPPKSGKFKFAHDPRVQFFPLMEFSTDYIMNLATAFQNNLLHIKAENGVNYVSEVMEGKVRECIAKHNSKLLRYITIKRAVHHVHLIEPEKVATNILQFLSDIK